MGRPQRLGCQSSLALARPRTRTDSDPDSGLQYSLAAAVVFRPLPFLAPAAVLNALRKRRALVQSHGLGSADIDASRRPKLAELLRLRPSAKLREDWSGASFARAGTTASAFRWRPWLWNALPRTISRRGSPMPGVDAGRAGRRHLAGRRTLLRSPCGRANVAFARRRHRPSAGSPRSGGGRPAGRAARGTVARHRPGGAHYRDRSFAPRRLGARRQHALWTGLALFEIATARFASSCGFLAGLLGRGALRAAGRQALHDSRRARDRADRGGAWTSPSPASTSSRRSSRSIVRSASGRSPGRDWFLLNPLSRRAPTDNAFQWT